MRKRALLVATLVVAGLLAAWAAYAATVKTYQVTGPVLDVSADMIAVQKGKDRWEIARDATSKVPADVKVGDKVTVTYHMVATTVEVKPATTAAPAKAPAAKPATTTAK